MLQKVKNMATYHDKVTVKKCMLYKIVPKKQKVQICLLLLLLFDGFFFVTLSLIISYIDNQLYTNNESGHGP